MKNMNCRQIENCEQAKYGMVKNTDGSYTFNGRKCILIDNGGRISVVWL